MATIPTLPNSNETYVKFDDDWRLIVRYSDAAESYVAALLDDTLHTVDRFSVDTLPSEGVLVATASALDRIGNEQDVGIFAFREDLTPVDADFRFIVDTDVMESLSKVPTDVMEKLVTDDTLDENLRTAMRIVLAERGME